MLAGETGEAHPIFGDQVKVHLREGRLTLSGDLDRREDRSALLRQASSRIGRGINHVDASALRVADRHEKAGILEQTLVAAYPDRATAGLARKLVLEHSRVAPKEEGIVDHADARRLRELVPKEFVDDATKRIEHGDALLILRVDETAGFKVRELLEEDTRSTWTIATPPRLSSGNGK